MRPALVRETREDRPAAVRLRNCSLSFGGVPVLKNVSLDVYRNEFVSILGPSGCGKSTLLRLMLGLVRPEGGGTIDFAGKSPRIGIVFQKPVLMPWLTALQNVELALSLGENKRKWPKRARREKADDAEMDGIHAHGRDHRIQDRRHDQDERSHVHRRSQEQEQDVDEQQDDINVVRDAQEQIRDEHRDFQIRQDEPEGFGCRDQEKHHGDGPERLFQDDDEMLEGQIPVDEKRQDERVHAGDRPGFGGREPAGKDPAQDDDAGHDRQDPVRDDARNFLEFDGFALLVPASCGYEKGGDQEPDQHEQGRNHARHEQGGDGHAARRHGVQDHVVAGGHDDALDGRHGGQPHAEVGGVFLFPHHRDHDGTDGRRVRGRRSGDVAEQETRHAVDQGQTAADGADEEHGQVDQPRGETALAHDHAGQDKERNGQKRKGIQPLDHLLSDGLEGKSRDPGCHDGGTHQHEGDRKAQQEHDQKGDDQCNQCGCGSGAHSGISSSNPLWRIVSMPIRWRKP